MEISPQELVFKAVSTENQFESLTVVNTTDEVIVFKVKTTAPKTYCVKPNASQANPGESVTVQISRSAKAANEASRDKFLVVSTPVSHELLAQNLDIHRLWEQIEKSNHTFNQEKIKVILRDSSAEPAESAEPAAAAQPAEAPSSEQAQRTPSVDSANAKSSDQTSAEVSASPVSPPQESKHLNAPDHSEIGSDVKTEENESNSSSRSSKSTRGKISTFLSKKKSVIMDKSPRRDRSSSRSREKHTGVTLKDSSSSTTSTSPTTDSTAHREPSPSTVAAAKELSSKVQKAPSEAARVGPTIDSSKVRTSAEPAVAIHAAAPSGHATQAPKVRTTGGTDPSTAGAAPVTVPTTQIVEKEQDSKPTSDSASGTGSDVAAPAPAPKALPEKTVENTAPTHPVKPRETSETKTVDLSDEVSRPGHIRAATSAHNNESNVARHDGVPLQTVFYIALLAFLCGYLLF